MTAVLTERTGDVVRITLNRPEKLNAMNEEVREGLAAAVASLVDAVDVKVVVIGGAGRSFSAGVDLMAGGRLAATWAQRRHEFGAWQRMLDALETIPPVTVARLHGHVVGGAALLAAACDIRIAADDVRVSIPEVAIGIPLTWSGLPRLAREIGLPMTRDIVMTGRVLDGEEALRCGYVQRLAPKAELDSALDLLIEQLVAMPAAPLQMTRASLRAIGRASGADAAAWADADLLLAATIEPEGHEIRLGYMERRKLKTPQK